MVLDFEIVLSSNKSILRQFYNMALIRESFPYKLGSRANIP